MRFRAFGVRWFLHATKMRRVFQAFDSAKRKLKGIGKMMMIRTLLFQRTGGGTIIRCLSTGKGFNNVRVRFAPSPTGLLHLGGFRTALLNYVFALKYEGKFILRIEDTDQTRLVAGAVEAIQEDLRWLDIQPHEGPFTNNNNSSFGPYIQSKRLSLYEESLKELIDKGHAYECFCSETRLDLIRREAIKARQVPRYDNKCRELTREEVKGKKATGQKYCVRFKLHPEIVKFKDMVHGTVEFNLTGNNYEGDPVIVKTDGFPTYHFANVVDDHFMEISHVLRGVEWQVSTPKHLQMYRAFGWSPPEYAHLPNVVNKDGTKLSKRQGDISMKHYREQFYYPRALSNFVTKSGGGFEDHGVDKIYSHLELAEMFDISQVNTAACRLDFELLSKLNQLELGHQIDVNLRPVLSSLQSLLERTTEGGQHHKDYLEKILKWCPERISTLQDLFTPEFAYLWSIPGEKSSSKTMNSSEVLYTFTKDLESFLTSSSLTNKEVSNFIKEYSKQNGLKFKTMMSDMRLILCGLEKGPPIADLISLFGPEDTIHRLKVGIEQIKSKRKSIAH